LNFSTHIQRFPTVTVGSPVLIPMQVPIAESWSAAGGSTRSGRTTMALRLQIPRSTLSDVVIPQRATPWPSL